ncbi:hypothetical protein BOX15_Mlig007235g3, partial [Macrostomum lignano]
SNSNSNSESVRSSISVSHTGSIKPEMKFLIALACLLAVAAANPLDSYILNGQNAALGQFPWMAKISGCSASVLNKRTILTAAHCVCNRAPSSVEVGTVRAGRGTSYRVSNTYIYPGYPTGSGCAVVRDYDLAVLKTSSDIAFNSNVQPIALFSGSEPSAGSAIISMGYGGDHNGISNVLNYAETTLTRSGCGSAYFCSSRQPNSIYFGDSGGPMVYRSGSTYYQLGVNSGISSTTSLYANVVRYASFINRYT